MFSLHQKHVFSIKGEELVPLADSLLTGLFIVLTKTGSEENEYAMKGTHIYSKCEYLT